MAIIPRFSFSSESVSYKNNYFLDKPNEDCVINDDLHGIYIILDGVSVDRENGIYPNPSPALEATKIFSSSVYNSLLEYNDSKNYLTNIKNAITEANLKLKHYNSINKFPFDAGTVGIVSILKENKLYYSYIGDCIGSVIRDKKAIIFTEEQTYLVKINKKKLTTNEIRFAICNNKSHPYGYGVYNGSCNALDFIRFGEIIIHENDIIVLATDGYGPYLNDIINNNYKTIFLSASPEMVGNKISDDRSIIIIKNN